MAGPVLNRLKWTSENVKHVRRHTGSVGAVDAVFKGSPRLFVKTGTGRGSHVMIGPDRRGRFWTVPMLDLGGGEWLPITCWPSVRREIQKYDLVGEEA